MATDKELVVLLREKTGLGMMACKEALEKNGGNVDKAIEDLRKKGELKAQARDARATKEGVIMSYIHSNNKIGAIVEINSETDFVAKNEELIDFARNMAMQIVALNAKFVSPEDVCEEMVAKEREIYVEQLKNEGKKGDMVEKILEGKIDKFKKELSLLEQPYIKDQTRKVKEILMDICSKMGENIKIKRFERFEVGM